MMRAVPFINTFTCLLIAATVFMSGTHAKDIATLSLPALWQEAKKQVGEGGQQIVKVASELHHHSDHSAKVLHMTSDGHEADTRSLRLLTHKKHTIRHDLRDRLRFWVAGAVPARLL